MKILYITSSFDKIGSASVRNVGLVNGLIHKGCEVDVLTQNWPELMRDEGILQYIDENVNIYRDEIKVITRFFSKKESYMSINSISSKIKKRIREIIKNIFFFPDIDKEWIKSYKKDLQYNTYDLVISSSDTKTAHFIAKKINKNYGIMWFAYWGDPWKDDMNIKGVKKYVVSFFEKKIVYASAANFYTSIPTVINIKNRFGDARNIYYLPRAFLEKINKRNEFVGNIIHLCYPGAIYYGRNILGLIERINRYNIEDHTYKFVLDIYGHCDPNLKLKCQNDTIIFHDQIDFCNMNKIINNTNGLIILMNDARSHQIPGKLYDFFGTNKSIIAIMPGKNDEVREFLLSTKRCLIFDYDNIIMEEIIEDIKNKAWEPLEEYSVENCASKLLEIFYNLTVDT